MAWPRLPRTAGEAAPLVRHTCGDTPAASEPAGRHRSELELITEWQTDREAEQPGHDRYGPEA